MKKIAFDVPKKMIQAAQTPGAQDAPYNVCLHCPFMGESCDGPDPLSMTNERWVEWISRLAGQLHITRQQIADCSALPLSTVNSVLSGRTKDVRHSTMQAITRAVVGDCWGKYPCHIAYLMLTGQTLEDESEHAAEISYLKEKVSELKQEREDIKAETSQKIDFLRRELDRRDFQIEQQNAAVRKRDRVIVGLSIALLVAAAVGLFIIELEHMFHIPA